MAAVRLSPTLRFFWWLHRTLLRVTGGRIGTRVNGMDHAYAEYERRTTRRIPVVLLERR